MLTFTCDEYRNHVESTPENSRKDSPTLDATLTVMNIVKLFLIGNMHLYLDQVISFL